MKNSRFLFSASATLALLPLIVFLPGCGGGSSGFGGIGSATATPGATATPTSTPSAANLFTGTVIPLSGNQTGTLNLTQNGNTLSGTITVAPTSIVNRKASAFSFTIPAGQYSVSGTFTPPRGVTLTGNFPAPVGAFSFTGTIPTTTQTGSYTLTAGGQNVTGTLPIIGGPFATATPSTTGTTAPTVTTPPVVTGGNFDLTIAQSGGANFGSGAFNPTAISGTKTTSSGITILALVGSEASLNNGYHRGVVLTISTTGTLAKDQVLPVTSLSSPTFPSIHVTPVINPGIPGQSPGSWGNIQAASGTATITAISGSSISLTLHDATVHGDYGAATGTLVLNGTATANYSAQ